MGWEEEVVGRGRKEERGRRKEEEERGGGDEGLILKRWRSKSRV